MNLLNKKSGIVISFNYHLMDCNYIKNIRIADII